MSPALRLMEMAKAACAAGCRPVLVAEGGAEFAHPFACTDHESFLRCWQPGDGVVADAYLPFHRLRDVLTRRIPFDLDLYCTSAPEASQNLPERSRWRDARGRRQHILTYAFAIPAAERVYVSTHAQIPMLSGALYHAPYFPAVQASASLPAKCMVLPMGVPTFPEAIAASPYPDSLRGRPLFLWGGGIWDWFDTETVLQAFAQFPDPANGPALFFLSATNHRPDAKADTPALRTARRAEELGLLGRNVFFNDRIVGPEDLPAYVQHAAAGIMANPPSWEAGISWRTRYLDLLAAGKPLVVAGKDPLGERMTDAGAALSVQAGDASSLSRALLECSGRSGDFAAASRRLGQELSWDRILGAWTARLRDPRSFTSSGPVPSPLWLLRHRIGI